MSLMLHCGASEVKLHELKDIPVTPRVWHYIGKDGTPKVKERSERWEGIQHYDFADAVLSAAAEKGMPVDHQRTRWGVSENGADLFGYVKFHTEINGRPTILSQHVTNEVEPAMGLRHSNLSLFAAKATVGGDCFVCDNMAITGEVAFNYKHTSGNVASLKDLIGVGLLKYLEKIPELGHMIESLKQRTITDTRLADTYLRAGRSHLLPWSHLGMVDKFWQNPTHPEFARQHDGWRLYNAFNTVAKKYNPTRQIEMVSKLHETIIPKEKEICF